MQDTPWDAVVLAGGGGRRLGGVDKPAVEVGGRSLLDRVLTACAGAQTAVVVGPPRPLRTRATAVVWTREEPPGGGPLAGLAAGLRLVRQPLVVVLAGDLPFLSADLLAALRRVPEGADGLVARDPEGYDQPLTACYRTEVLRGALGRLAPDQGGPADLPLRAVTRTLTLGRVAVGNTLDCDTWADISAARARIREHEHVLDEWIAAVKAELDIDPEVDVKALLDAARDAAHNVARPAAPLTTFLIGYAVARHGRGQAEAARAVGELAERWARERQGEPKEQ
ncbi:NTP transferase domain-containing protein [Streptomyces aidingensis]|nr:NTP transferase domain-containing protein [Streptomyces aidingensis]